MFLSFIILVIATILWPFVIPISFLELFKALKIRLSSMTLLDRNPHSPTYVKIATAIGGDQPGNDRATDYAHSEGGCNS
jgi:hypothetical protein